MPTTRTTISGHIQPQPVPDGMALNRTFGGHHVYAATAFGWYKLVCWLDLAAFHGDSRWQWRLEKPDGNRIKVGYAQLKALQAKGLLWVMHESDVAGQELPVGEHGRAAARELHVEMGRQGIRNHYRFAAQALRVPKVYRLSLLTTAQRERIRAALAERGAPVTLNESTYAA